jgi:hypothetical protein
MREFSKISPAVWQSARFNNLPSLEGRYLYLYLLTSRHQTSAGCYQLPDGYACTDLGWPIERYTDARRELSEAGLIGFDPEASVVMITRWFKHNPPMSASHLTGIERILERLASDEIRMAAQEALRESWESIEAEKAAKASRGRNRTSGPDKGPNGPPHLNTSYMNRTNGGRDVY